MKKPVIAAILNIYPGLGYLYLDAKQFVAWLMYYAFTFAVVGLFNTMTSTDKPSDFTTGFWVWLTLIALLWVALIIDAYREASSREESQLIRQKSLAMAAGHFLGRAAVVYS